MKGDPRFSPEQRNLLSRYYELKNTAGYEVGEAPTGEITTEHAAARGFVAGVHTLLSEEA